MTRLAFAFLLCGSLLTREGLARADDAPGTHGPAAAPCGSTETGDDVDDDNPETCATCGVGAVALLLAGTAPLTTAAALGLLAANQAGVITEDPVASFGIPLWGCALGCAGAHVFLAVVSSIAFGRDVVRLCGSYMDDEPHPGPTTQPACEPTPGPIETEVQQAAVPY
ncbi:MAG: hypothetical protein ABIJ09_05970 [Pseudomonadota bacterium]